MECLGCRRGSDVAALSASARTPTGFAALSSDGTVSLWDVRLKNKNYLTIRSACRDGSEGTELLFAADKNLVVALCDRQVRFFDVRKEMAVVATYRHPCELVRFVAGTHPAEQRTTLMIDEEGAVLPLDLATMQPTVELEDWVFGQRQCCDSGGFGGLGNYCCGIGLLEVCDVEGENEEQAGQHRVLMTLAMDGKGQLHGSAAQAIPFELSLDLASSSGSGGAAGQVFNPPLPTCCSFYSDRLAVGRADGTYELLQLEGLGTSLTELMAAPGHASNGLCSVHLAEEGHHLLTVSLCGQVTLWDVEAFLNSTEEDDDGELPAVLSALDHRETTGSAKAVINAVAELDLGKYVLGDTEGNITLADTAQ